MAKLKNQKGLDDYRNLWLQKYHNTSVSEVVENYPESLLRTPDWFKLFPCTDEQEREWVKEAKQMVMKDTGYSRKLIDKSFWAIYLNGCPRTLTRGNTAENFQVNANIYTNAMDLHDIFEGHDRITAFKFFGDSPIAPKTPIRVKVIEINKRKDYITVQCLVDPVKPWLRGCKFRLYPGNFGYEFFR